MIKAADLLACSLITQVLSRHTPVERRSAVGILAKAPGDLPLPFTLSTDDRRGYRETVP